MEYLCPSSDGWGPLSLARPADLTICFQHGAFVVVLNGLFFMIAIAHMHYFRNAVELPREVVVRRLLWVKVSICIVALFASLYELIAMSKIYPGTSIFTISLALQTTAAIAAVCLQYREHTVNPIASTPLLLFWLVSGLLSLIRLRSIVTMSYYNSHLAVVAASSVYMLSAFTNLVLECRSRPDKLYKSLDDNSSIYSTSYSPEERASIFSQITFSWITPLLEKGLHKTLNFEDTLHVVKALRPELIVNTFGAIWLSEKKSTKPSLIRATVRMCGRSWLLSVLYRFVRDMLTLLHPILVSRLIGFIVSYNTDQTEPIENGYFYAVAMFVTISASACFLQLNFAVNRYMEAQVKSSYIVPIFEKALVLSNTSRQQHNIGSIISHVSVDAERVASFITHDASLLITIPIYIVLALNMLYRTLGWSVFPGVLALIISIPTTSYLSKRMSMLKKEQVSHRDERIRIMEEVLAGIRVIKLYAWELSFIQRIDKIRNKLELASLRRYGLLQALLSLINMFFPFIVSFLTFAIYSLAENKSHGPLTSQLVFVALMLFNMLKEPLSMLSEELPLYLDAVVSYRRLCKFLLAEELNFTSIERAPYDRNSPNSDTSDVLVSVQNGTFKWLPSDNSTLDNISLKCKRGELVAIIGQVGCGKSSLASAILGEMIKCSGSVEVSGSIAYVPQTPWILNATLRENITFGSSYDESFYNKVIDACALQQDIDVLPTGDMTEIGEKGINLSGGQKARVSLARAVYSRADVYILDDPLAAVDAHVSKHLFTHVLGPQGMLQSRARILVTNAVQYLNNVDNIIMLRDGEIIEHCSFAEAMNNQDVIHKFIHKYVNNDRDFESGEDSNVTSTEVTSQTTTKLLGHVEVVGATSPPTQCSNQDAAIKSDNHIGRTTTDEVSEKGKVQMNVYRSYANACGGLNTVMFSITLMCTLVISIATNMWLKHWASVNDESNSMKLPAQAHAKGALYYLLIYGGLGLSHMLASYLNALIIWVRCLIQASTKIHSNMLISVVRSPVSFFDTTPTGRIINRFASDLTRCDNMVPAVISKVARDVTSLVVSAIIIGYTTPPMLVIIILFLFVSQRLQRMFLCSSRELRRLESTTGSPIIAQFQETIGGAASIRAYGHQPRFLKMLETRLGHNIQVSYNYWIIKRWLSTRLNIFGNIIVFGTSLLAVMSVHLYGVRDAALVGLAITYAFELSNIIRFSVRSYTDMEDSMTHVERALEYARLLPESAAIVEDNRSKDSWPEHGALEFKNYSARYRDGLDLVLKDLTFSVLPRQKVGIVGRTGAGKSSLSLALFRIIESAGGMILLDGKDISKYGLYDVRSKLSIIPQDPVLFAGTVRENLDPFNNYSDQDIWCALEQAHLADYIRSKDERLEFLIAQSSDNFSIGQRQLVCLARALLKHAKVLVLDEATAAIDNATDEIIQQTIRTEFKDCTVLTIAHRLNTIIDSDMVLVIDNGRIAEYNTPQRLLANKKSLFAKLVEEAKRSD